MILSAALVPFHKKLSSTAQRNKDGEGRQTAISEMAQFTLVESS